MFFTQNSTEFLPIQLSLPPIPEAIPIPPIPSVPEIPPTIQVPPPPTIAPPLIDIIPPIPEVIPIPPIPSVPEIPAPPTIAPPPPINIVPPIPEVIPIPPIPSVPEIPAPPIITPPPPINIVPPIPETVPIPAIPSVPEIPAPPTIAPPPPINIVPPIQLSPPPETIPNSPEIVPITTTPLTLSPVIDPLTGMSMEELQVVELTNNIRLQNALPPLTPNPQLAVAADVHSQNMAYQDFFDHVGLDGSQPWDRANRAGYFSSFVGENLGAGYSTADEAVQGWINSPGHLDNILNPNYTQIGVGYEYLANDGGMQNFNHYWTQVFGN